jgi:hypothetical protein
MHRATVVRALVCGLVVAAAIGGNQAAGARSAAAAGAGRLPPLAAYEWHKVSQLGTFPTPQELRLLRREGFTTVYVDLGEYLDVADQPPSWVQRARLRALDRTLRRFVADASSLGLAVQGVGADPTWTDPARRYLGPRLVQLVGRYNAGAGERERLQGIQFDIESYTDPSFRSRERAAVTDYLDTLQAIVNRYRQVRTMRASRDLQLGWALPFWFDEEAGSPSPVPFNGTTAPAAFHVFDMLGDLPDAYVVVMSYRWFTGGPDGSIAHTDGEFRYASSIGARCGIVVGQEFAEDDPATTTFHGLGRDVFKQAARELTDAFGRYPQFRGLSVDDLESYVSGRPVTRSLQARW